MTSEKFSGQSKLDRLEVDRSAWRGRPSFEKRGGGGASWEEVRNEADRVARVKELGLLEDTSWGKIFTVLNEQERVATSQGLGLSGDASWRHIMLTALDLHTTASVEEIIEKARAIKKGVK